MNLRGLIAVVVLATTCVGCEARSSVEAAQTAVVVAQTALPAAGDLGGRLQPLLVGVALDITTTPDGAPGDAVTNVTIVGTDGNGRLAGVDPRARQAAGTAALLAAAGYYPNATISLTVVDGSGAPLVSGTKAPGQSPSVQ